MQDSRALRRVAVLLSSYNGEKYIRQQVASILSQLAPHDALLIRDDGSTDATQDIVCALNDSRIRLIPGTNVGFASSFFWLLHHVDLNYDVFLLADQDDVWLPGKIERARRALTNRAEPSLYCTRLRLVDEHLNPIGLSPLFTRPPQLWNALCENIATGCTIALNRPALELIRQVPYHELTANGLYFHDWWLYLCISAFGTVSYDPAPSILYRQHGNNMVGMGRGFGRYIKILQSLRRLPWTPLMLGQIRTFHRFYGARLQANHAIEAVRIARLATSVRWVAYLRALLCPHFVRQTVGGLWLLRCLLALEFIAGRR